jgi:Uma2 family endonuclease
MASSYAVWTWRGFDVTTAEYLQTEETVLPRELAHGVLRVADAPRVPHQRVVVDLLLALAPHVRKHRLGEVIVAPVDVILDYGASLVVQPDLVIVSPERASRVSDRIYGAPDAVIDVLSPHPRLGRLHEHVGWYAKAGVRECWLVSLVERRVVILELSPKGIQRRQMHAAGETVASTVVPALRVPQDLFSTYR